MSRYWFRPKKYGWGLQPVTWQGGVAVLCLCTLIMVSFYSNALVIMIKGQAVPAAGWLRFALDVIVLSAVFMLIFKSRTDGEIKWRWGKDE